MSIKVRPTHTDFVAEFSGIDPGRPLKSADRDAIEDVINRYAVVVFHNQKLTDDQQIAFAGNFGPIHSSAQRARHRSIKHRLHRAQPFDTTEVRELRRVTTRDVASTLEQAA